MTTYLGRKRDIEHINVSYKTTCQHCGTILPAGHSAWVDWNTGAIYCPRHMPSREVITVIRDSDK